MKLPIIVCEGMDINMFSTLEDACSYLEPTDVQKGTYSAYDSDGYLLTLSVIEKQRSYFGFLNFKNLAVNIENTMEKNKSGELINKLVAFLTVVGEKEVKNTDNLPDLIELTKAALSK